MSSSLRTGVSFSAIPFRNLSKQRKLHSIASVIRSNGCGLSVRPNGPRAHLHPMTMAAQSRSRVHAYISSASRTPPASNDLTEELQTLSATATEMLEIATDSTHNDSVDATSDVESARDALNQLATVYELYTTGEEINELGGGDGATKAGQPPPGIKIAFDPKNISDALRADIRNRFEQKVLELRKAVRRIEEKAQI